MYMSTVGGRVNLYNTRSIRTNTSVDVTYGRVFVCVLAPPPGTLDVHVGIMLMLMRDS